MPEYPEQTVEEMKGGPTGLDLNEQEITALPLFGPNDPTLEEETDDGSE